MKKGKKRVIPGFGLTMGVTITMLSIVVLIPLASLVVYSSQLGLGEFFEVITRKRVLSSFYVSFITALGASLVNAVMGLILAWVLVRYEFPAINTTLPYSPRHRPNASPVPVRSGGRSSGRMTLRKISPCSDAGCPLTLG